MLAYVGSCVGCLGIRHCNFGEKIDLLNPVVDLLIDVPTFVLISTDHRSKMSFPTEVIMIAVPANVSRA